MNRHLFELKDLELHGGLTAYLLRARAEKKSYRTMALELSQTGATVGRSAVEEWCKEAAAKVARTKRKRK
jgi:hypothetical protein